MLVPQQFALFECLLCSEDYNAALRFKDESGVIYTLHISVECLNLSWEAVAVAKESILKEGGNQFLTFFFFVP